ncbi:MAG: chemotaxis-specific protein-glutamate methyltransferase CheB [Erythrobacter sp.]|uniref:chemotaxis-specific protein-glutamate methyltransferase CheB n=1 Tax=Erythrobacter sp. TaxID=1042 RepID=UPI002630DA2A|nr:chemotaxis-specific protein-glutamate methyltransferase CheB [Erythrobacter sp.]MDJ0978971.1 chemotaxis-specific protein-glutamate methyltransferase CheB [Erythrobacter sp.]
MNAQLPASRSEMSERMRGKLRTPGDDTPSQAEAAIRVMIVDDSLTVRTIFKRMVESDASMKVTATASSAERAIAELKSVPADVILLDLEMPGMGGLEALPEILKRAAGGQVLVVSSLTQDGAEHTVSALSMGAADTMLKPRPGGFNEDYRAQLLGKIRALGGAKGDVRADSARARAPDATTIEKDKAQFSRPPEIVAIGASTGGIHALNILLRGLTPDFYCPILITQHLPSTFIPVFARQVEMACARPAVIAEDGTEIRRGQVVIATGHGHMIVTRRGNKLVTRTSCEPARSGCLPSVDPMFASLAQSCGNRVLALVLSGMGRDGLEGARALVDAGSTVFAQDAETSAVWGMPGAVAKAGLASLIARPEELRERMLGAVQGVVASERG